MHEKLESLEQDLELPSNRSFGFKLGTILLVIAVVSWFSAGAVTKVGAVCSVLGAVLILSALLCPDKLAPVNRAWMKIGLILSIVVSPIIMGLVFFVTVTPVAVAMRALGKRPLRLRYDKEARTYWIAREPPGPAPETMRQQF